MKVIIGMDSFKGSLSSKDANAAVANGIKTIYPDAETAGFPMADGGEGTVETLVDGMDGLLINIEVTGPLGEAVQSSYGLIENKNMAVIEVASACGLPLLTKDELDPMKATTYGVGELIKHAYRNGARKFIIGLGGSATNDGGVGMLQAMGYQFLDADGQEIGYGGGVLANIEEIHEPSNPWYKECTFRVACDVNNVLYGEKGATYIFGPQKGATKDTLPVLDSGMKHYAEMTRSQMDIDISNVEGGGAAGGLGAAFHGCLDGHLESGIELIIDVLQVKDHLEEADLVITGEGRLDGQTSMGKVPAGLAIAAKEFDIPVIGIGGSLTDDAFTLNDSGIDAVFSIQNSPMSLEEAMDRQLTKLNLERTVEQVMRLLKVRT